MQRLHLYTTYIHMYKKTKDFFQIASHIPVFFTLVVFSVQMDDVFDGKYFYDVLVVLNDVLS